MHIRDEIPGDRQAVHAIHVASFPTPAEADLVDQLRRDGSAVYSLVAEIDGRTVGHVMFSRMQSPPETLGLAPVAVLEDARRHGIAAMLIEQGLTRAKQDRWVGAFVLGDLAYYGRFGFDPALTRGYSSRYAGPHLMGLAFKAGELKSEGVLEYAPALAALG
jgi:putative acetyltransferase